jgi:hypothetical protein
MYLMYIDESGDTGINNSPTKYFVLSAIVIHEEKWLEVLDDLINFRKYLKQRFGLGMREEIHAADWLNKDPKLKANIAKNDRLDILKKCLIWLSQRNDLSIYSVRCDKDMNQNKDIFEYTWRVFIQRFENTLSFHNFPGGNATDKGILIPDDTHGQKLTKLLREMRRYNPVPNKSGLYGGGVRNIRLRAVIEDPIMRDSSESYFHQMSDVVAFFARMCYEPNRYVRKKGARTFYSFLENVVNQKVTNKQTTNRIVEI